MCAALQPVDSARLQLAFAQKHLHSGRRPECRFHMLSLTGCHACLQHYGLIDAKELAPLQELIDQFAGGMIR